MHYVENVVQLKAETMREMVSLFRLLSFTLLSYFFLMSFRYTKPDALPPIVKNLIFINALFFLATGFLFRDIGDHGLQGIFGLWPVNHENFRPYQVFTHMFTHGDLFHILFNMFALWMFGRMLENIWGPKKFLLFYLVCGIGSAIAHMRS